MRFRRLRAIVTIALRADRMRTVGVLAIAATEGLIRAAFPLWLKFVVDGVLGNNATRIVAGAVGYGLSLAVLGVLNVARINLGAVLVEKTGLVLDQELMELAAASPTLEHYETATYRNELELLREQRSAVVGTVNALVSNVLVATSFLGTVGLLTSVHPALVLLPLFSLPSMVAAQRAGQRDQTARKATIEPLRGAGHLFGLATTAEPGKELRIFGLSEEITSRHRDLWQQHDRVLGKAERQSAAWTSLGWGFFGLGYVGALAVVVASAVNHPSQTSPGDVLLAFRAAEGINQAVSNTAAVVGWMTRCLQTVGRLLWLRDFVAERLDMTTGSIAPPPRLTAGIRLDDIEFSYPETEAAVLRGISVDFPAGSTVALVGENGAGKTTLVKLLCGFYRPTNGRITVDGTDLSDLDLDQWRAATSAGFQDFAKFELLLREGVGIGDLPQVHDVDAVTQALRRAHGADIVDQLPGGLETQLGKSFEGGHELSVGQWQKVALGRAMMRSAPLLLVLDEPTASLDAETEHLLFERYGAAARSAADSHGAITVLVSHRFSTVRMADLIVVMDDGAIAEVGSHQELMRSGGLYAELYELQAGAYR